MALRHLDQNGETPLMVILCHNKQLYKKSDLKSKNWKTWLNTEKWTQGFPAPSSSYRIPFIKHNSINRGNTAVPEKGATLPFFWSVVLCRHRATLGTSIQEFFFGLDAGLQNGTAHAKHDSPHSPRANSPIASILFFFCRNWRTNQMSHPLFSMKLLHSVEALISLWWSCCELPLPFL